MASDKFTKILDIEVNYTSAVQALAEYSKAVQQAKDSISQLNELKKKGAIDEDQYHRQLQTTKVALTENQYVLRKLAKEMQNTVKMQQYNEGSLFALRAELSNLTKQYDELSRKERQSAKGDELRAKINNLTKELKDAEMQTQRFYRNVGNYPQVMAQMGRGINGIISTIPGLSGLGSAIGGIGTAIQSMASGIGGAVGTLGVFGAAAVATTAVVGALGAAFTSGAETAMSFNAAVSQLAAIRGTNAEGVKQLTDLAREYGATTKYTATEVVQLQTELAKLGYSMGDISNMTGSVLSLAQATGVSLAEAAALSGATLRMFGDDTTHTAEYVDKMAAACTNSALDFHYLQNAMSTVGPVANAFGFSIEDVLALLGQLANAGFDASSAATATRNILLNLADDSGALAKQLGKPVTNLDELVDGLKKLDNAGINLAESLSLTDKRSVSAFNTYIQQADGARELRDALLASDGAAKQMAETMADNLQGDVNTLSSAWQEFTLKLNGSQSVLRSIVQWLTEVVRKAGEVYGTLKYQLADLYNNSIAFRFVVQGIGTAFKVAADVAKAAFGVLGDIVVGFGKTLKGAFTLDWKLFADGIEQFAAATGKNLHKMLVNIKNDAVDAAKEIASGSVDVEGQGDTGATGESPTEPTEKKKRNNKGMGITDDKTKKAQDNARKAELEAQQAYEKSLTELIEDSAEKRRKQIRDKYDKEIADLEHKLATETNLSKSAQDNLRATISNKRIQMQKELDALEAKLSAESVKRRQEEITLELAAVKKGSEQEYQLLLQQNALKEEAELAAAAQSITNKEELERRKVLIAAKYAAEEEKIQNDHERKMREIEEKAIANRWTEQMMAASDNEVKMAELEVERRKETLDTIHQRENESEVEFNARRLEAEKAYTESKKSLVEKQNQVEQSKYQVAESVTSGLTKILDSFSDENKSIARASKILALAEVAINTGKAISAGVASAQTMPYPANIAAVATTITTIMTNIATAISSIKSARFAKGGVDIRGAGTSTSDSIPAMISNGESVMTARATEMFGGLLVIMNKVAASPTYTLPTSVMRQAPVEQRTDAEAIRTAIADIHPIVSVEEINRVSKQVEVVENLDTM